MTIVVPDQVDALPHPPEPERPSSSGRSSSSITVRRAGVDDLPAIFELGYAMLKESVIAFPELNEAAMYTRLEQFEQAGMPYFMALAEQGPGHAIGMITAQPGIYLFSNRICAMHDIFYVRPDKRGSRAALLLVRAFEEWGHSIGAGEARRSGRQIRDHRLMSIYDLYSAAGDYLETLAPRRGRVDLPGKITIHNLDGLDDAALNAHKIYRREEVPIPTHNPLTHKVTTSFAIAGARSRPSHTVVALPTAKSDALVAEARRGAKQGIKREGQRRIEETVPYWMVVAAVSGARTPNWTDVNALIARAELLISQANNATPDQLNGFNPRDDANWP